ncbi:MAG: hypothetical protein SFY70_08250 [Bacteroidia bacterium]|nr:hypothetical protein [Bacteroidia bacterium]
MRLLFLRLLLEDPTPTGQPAPQGDLPQGAAVGEPDDGWPHSPTPAAPQDPTPPTPGT